MRECSHSRCGTCHTCTCKSQHIRPVTKVDEMFKCNDIPRETFRLGLGYVIKCTLILRRASKYNRFFKNTTHSVCSLRHERTKVQGTSIVHTNTAALGMFAVDTSEILSFMHIQECRTCTRSPIYVVHCVFAQKRTLFSPLLFLLGKHAIQAEHVKAAAGSRRVRSSPSARKGFGSSASVSY